MSQSKIHWTVFLLLPAASIATLTAIMTFPVDGEIMIGLFWTVMAIWMFFVARKLMKHEMVGQVQHGLASIVAGLTNLIFLVGLIAGLLE